MLRENNQILIIEDEPAIAELIAFTVRSAGWEPVNIYSGTNALKFLEHTQHSLILLDWMLPDLSGLDILKKIRGTSRLRNIPVIMLTARATENDKVSGLNNGADDYITKPFSPKELVARINALLRRKAPEKSKTIFTVGRLILDTETCQVTVDGNTVEMGMSEYLLLKFLIANPDRVYSRTQLLDNIGTDSLDIEERTIDARIARIRKALGDCSNMIRTVRSIGYTLSTKKQAV